LKIYVGTRDRSTQEFQAVYRQKIGQEGNTYDDIGNLNVNRIWKTRKTCSH